MHIVRITRADTTWLGHSDRFIYMCCIFWREGGQPSLQLPPIRASNERGDQENRPETGVSANVVEHCLGRFDNQYADGWLTCGVVRSRQASVDRLTDSISRLYKVLILHVYKGSGWMNIP